MQFITFLRHVSRKFYWTPRARAVFASLGRRGKVSLPDLLVDTGLQGKTAQSSLVQSLGCWARRGLVTIDRTAPHRAPRYSLTAEGRALWNEAVITARGKAEMFFSSPRIAVPLPAGENLPRQGRKIAADTVACPECGERYALQDLCQMKAQFGRVACTCNRGLAAELAELERQEEK